MYWPRRLVVEVCRHDDTVADDEMTTTDTGSYESEQEQRLLRSIKAEHPARPFMLELLRLAPAATVSVAVSMAWQRCHGFNGDDRNAAVAAAAYVPAIIKRLSSRDELAFELSCEAHPEFHKEWKGEDDVMDHLLEYFNQEVFTAGEDATAAGDDVEEESSGLEEISRLNGGEKPLSIEVGSVAEDGTGHWSYDGRVTPTASELAVLDDLPGQAEQEAKARGSIIEGNEQKKLFGSDDEDSDEASAKPAKPAKRRRDSSPPGEEEMPGGGEFELGPRSTDHSATAEALLTEVAEGMRLRIERAGCVRATVISVNGDVILVAHDDCFYAGYALAEFQKVLQEGDDIRILQPSEDVDVSERLAMLIAPVTMQERSGCPSLFLFGESILGVPTAKSHRWFSGIVPAPADGTFEQKYSAPPLEKSMKPGDGIMLCDGAQVAPLVPRPKGGNHRARMAVAELTLETRFTYLGVVRIALASQYRFYVVLDHAGTRHVVAVTQLVRPSESSASAAEVDELVKRAKEELEGRTAAAIDSGVKAATKVRQPAAAEEGKVEQGDHPAEQDEQKAAAVDVAVDPFAAKFDLDGVGKQRLMQCSVKELVATCLARDLATQPSEHRLLVARLEQWKREQSLSRRGSDTGSTKSRPSTRDDDDEEEDEGACSHSPLSTPYSLLSTLYSLGLLSTLYSL